jgi:hypothetical protein
MQGDHDEVAGRAYARVYRTSRRKPLHEFLLQAVEASGGQVLYASSSERAPVYLGVQGVNDERIGILAYPFTANQVVTGGRPPDEHRLQIRYGAEKSWETQDHYLGVDAAYVDTTVVLGVHIERGLFVGLDPALYNPLPMGISFEFKEAEVAEAVRSGWHVFERESKSGKRRDARVVDSLETVVLFAPQHFLRYVKLEREATDLRYDPPLRFVAATAVPRDAQTAMVGSLHRLERDFDLSSAEILDMISKRNRLAVAVRGGIAEVHLERYLQSHPKVVAVEGLDLDGQPDFKIRLADGRLVTVECKNSSPRASKDGEYKVEVQKTRASKSDPASRLYRLDQFDLVATCLFPATRRWEFRFRRAAALERHPNFPDRIRPIQSVGSMWARDIVVAMDAVPGHPPVSRLFPREADDSPG